MLLHVVEKARRRAQKQNKKFAVCHMSNLAFSRRLGPAPFSIALSRYYHFSTVTVQQFKVGVNSEVNFLPVTFVHVALMHVVLYNWFA